MAHNMQVDRKTPLERRQITEVEQDIEAGLEHNVDEGPSRPAQGQKRKSASEASKSKSKKKAAKWGALLESKGVLCERQVLHHQFDESSKIRKTLEHYGLESFYKPVVGYVLEFVCEFYKNVVILQDGNIESKVKGRDVVVNPLAIAEFIGFKSPAPVDIEYSGIEHMDLSIDELVGQIYDEPSNFKGKFQLGKLKDDYRTLHKVIHYNIMPKGSEKVPARPEIEFLCAVYENRSIDVATVIFAVIKEFIISQSPRRKMPFGHMLSCFCIAAKVRLGPGEAWMVGSPGPIGKSSASKSKVMSRTTATPSPAASTAPPTLKGRTVLDKVQQCFDILFCRQTGIMNSQEKLDKKIDFCVSTLEKQFGVTFSDSGTSGTMPVVGGDDSDSSTEEEEEEEEQESEDEE